MSSLRYYDWLKLKNSELEIVHFNIYTSGVGLVFRDRELLFNREGFFQRTRTELPSMRGLRVSVFSVVQFGDVFELAEVGFGLEIKGTKRITLEDRARFMKNSPVVLYMGSVETFSQILVLKLH